MDRIDDAILAALQNDGRMSNKELAAAVGLAPSSCLERVRRLHSRGVITGFHAELEPAALAIGLQAFVFVRLARHVRDDVETFRDYVAALPEVVGVYHVAGVEDFVRQLEPGDYISVVDIASFYLKLPMHPSLYPYHVYRDDWREARAMIIDGPTAIQRQGTLQEGIRKWSGVVEFVTTIHAFDDCWNRLVHG